MVESESSIVPQAPYLVSASPIRTSTQLMSLSVENIETRACRTMQAAEVVDQVAPVSFFPSRDELPRALLGSV